MVDVPVLDPLDRPPMVASLSPSSMATWRQCPKRFFFEKILRLEVEPTEPAVCGSFVHLVLEHLMGRPPGERTADVARGIAAEVWPAFCADPESQFLDLDLDAEATKAFKRRAWSGIAGYFVIEDPNRVDVVGTEEEVRAELGGAPVYGIIDRIDQGGDGLVVTDYKSGKAPAWDNEREEKLGQLRTYAALLEATGRRVTELRLLFVSPQLSAGARAERCARAAAAAEDDLAGALGGSWDAAVAAAVAAVGEIEAAIATARAAALDRTAARAEADEAAALAAAAVADRLAAELGTAAPRPDAAVLRSLIDTAITARRRAFFAQRTLQGTRPTSVSLRVQEADLEQARLEASTIWAEASACYDAWDFPGRTGALCDWCPFASRCETFLAWDAAGRPAPEMAMPAAPVPPPAVAPAVPVA